MTWPSIREFLRIPDAFTGKGVNIAVIDSSFTHHPDIASNENRNTYIIKTSEYHPKPLLMHASLGPWKKGLHGLSSSAAAAGSGELSGGYYTGAAPAVNLYLLETGPFHTSDEIEVKMVRALEWLKESWRLYNIRGVVLTVTASRDTGLLPWQADPVRVKCEELIAEGLLIVSSSGNTKDVTCNGPSASPSVLSVGGIIVSQDANCKEALPYHGCRGVTFEGKWVPEILAPAENIVLPVPFQSEAEYLDHYSAPYDNLPAGYARIEGTSYSGPIILGAAACIWEARPWLSGSQMKSLLIGSSWTTQIIWNELRSGVVDVSAAINSLPPIMTQSPEIPKSMESMGKPYLNMEKWKGSAEKERLEALTSEDEQEVTAALLSCLLEPSSSKITQDLRRTLPRHLSDKVRAASILLVSECGMAITSVELSHLLKDESSYVRMAALYALEKYPDLWDELIDDLISLFQDKDSNIRYCALQLASTLKNPYFIAPIISELKNDALNQNVSIFGAGCKTLEQITGVHIEPVPVFRDGQCWYSEASNESRLFIARKWEEWYRQKR